jgi:hypothetical protein
LPQFKKTLAPIHERWTDLRNRPLNKEEREEKRRISPQREHWRYQISSCNQALQNMIEFTANRLVKPEELTKVIQGLWRSPNPKDAELYVRGIQAEIAAAHCIAQSGREVTYSSIEEDMCGKDIWVMGISGNKIGYDIKCTPLSSSYGIEKENAIFIDPSWLDDYQIRPEFVSMVLKQL